MEVSINDFKKNVSTYFDKVYSTHEDLIIKKRGLRLRLIYEFDDKDESNFDSAVKSEEIRNKMSVLSSKL